MIVLDASVILGVLADDDDLGGGAARGVAWPLRPWHAPDHVDIEVVSALRGRWLGGKLSESRLLDAVQDVQGLPLTRYPTRHLLGRVVELRNNLTPYDAAYVALAEQLGCPLLTADARLGRAPGIECEVVVLTA